MSRRRNGDGSVRGPASALTNFLASLGVEPSALNSNPYAPRQDDSTPQAGSSSGPGTTPIPEEPEQQDEDIDSDDLDEAPRRPAKRARVASVDSDDLDADSPSAATDSGSATPASNGLAPGARVRASALKAVGEFMACGECGKTFTVTAYTKEHPSRSRTWLCVQCCPKLGVDAFAKPKKASATKKPVPKKAERGKIVHYEETKGAIPLGDICIKLIGEHIDDVESLGDIGAFNLDQVCQIICKNRVLTPENAKLFYSTDRQDLAIYDCTNLVHESYLTLANLCPNLVSLNLQMCGQISTDTLKAWGKSLKHLKNLELNGPFLIRKEGWVDFINARGTHLESLRITQSPRIDLETIELLVKKCKNLKCLQLSEVGQLNSDFLAPLSKLSKLESLAITCPGDKLVVEDGDGTPVSDEAVEELLAKIGGHLTSLDLSDNRELTDASLASIGKHCKRLSSLSLRHNDLSDDGVAAFFKGLEAVKRPGFKHLDFEKGHDLSSAALDAIVSHSGQTLEYLSILGWRTVSADAVSLLAGCKRLQFLDLGWCRNVTDFTVKDVLDGCDAIKTVRVWGCNQLTDRVPRKRGVKVVGIETHAI